jgi:hypothetical protein
MYVAGTQAAAFKVGKCAVARTAHGMAPPHASAFQRLADVRAWTSTFAETASHSALAENQLVKPHRQSLSIQQRQSGSMDSPFSDS